MKKVLWFIAIALMISLPAYGWIMAPVVGGVAAVGSSYGYISSISYGDPNSPDTPDDLTLAGNANTTTVSPITMSENGTANAIKVYIAGTASSNWSCVLYDDNSSNPNNLIDSTSEQGTPATGSWTDWIELQTKPSLSVSTTYYIGYATTVTSALGRDSSGSRYSRHNSYKPDPFGSIDYNNTFYGGAFILRYIK